MKKLLSKLFAFVVVIFVANSCNEGLLTEQQEEALELKSVNQALKSYIITLNDAGLNEELPQLKGYVQRENAILQASSRILNRSGVSGEVEHLYSTAIIGFSVKLPPAQVDKLQNDPAVVRIEEDKIMTLIEPSSVSLSGDLEAQSESTPYGIKRVNGGASYTGNKVAWIIDTGIDLDHPDLNVDTSRGAYFVGRGTSSSNDDNGHGTHVAGTIAAIGGNGIGVVGVAAGAVVIPIKVLDRNGSGTLSGVIDGVDHVAANAAAGDVANMSLGGGVSTTLDNAVKNAAANGIYFSLAAGNESDDANNHSPARANGTNIYTISAMDKYDNFASFSNYNNPPVDYCEPGVSVYSTYKDGGYATASGTSMAAPHMAGILLWGAATTNGNVKGDPDGNADPIGVVGGGSSNNSPTAEAGPDQTVIDSNGDGTELVILDGSNSSDPQNDDLTYSWSVDGTEIGTGDTYSHNFAVGSHTVTLTVSDGEFSDSDDVIITVSDATNSTPTADAGLDQTVIDSDGDGTELVKLDGSNSSDPENDALTYSWSVDGSEIGTGETYSHNFAVGSHTVTLTVSDDEFTDSDDVIVTVSESTGNDAPTIGDVTITENSNPAWKRVSVDWTVNDIDGDLATVEFLFKDPSGKQVDTASAAVSGLSASGIQELANKQGPSGTYTVVITVTDKAGHSATGTYYKDLN